MYSGSAVKRGEVDAIVEATGKDTYFGKTARLVAEAHTVGHFQRAVLKIGNYLIALALGLVVLILLVALFRGDSMLTTLQFALILTVAAIPVAMPTVLSVTMAVGARLLARRQAIVSRLASIEELAGMDVLVSDKTGTLTQNRLTPGEPFVAPGVSAAEVLEAAALASRAEDEDPIDAAVLAAAKAPPGGEVLRFVPFDPVHKRTEATVRRADGSVVRASKGAPQVILALAEDGAALAPARDRGPRRLRRARASDRSASRAPARRAASASSASSRSPTRRARTRRPPSRARRRAASSVKMATGDQLAIAREIGREVGLGGEILDASGFADTAHHEAGALAEAIEQRRRLRPGLPRAQVPHRRGAPGARAHRGHDGRRRERRARAQEGRRRHRRLGRDGRRARRGRSGAPLAGPRRHPPRGGGEPPHLPAHAELRDLPHRRDDPRPRCS